MSIAQHSLLASPLGTGHWVERAKVAVADLLREWSVQRELGRLHELDGATLQDIGLNRGGLESAVRFGRRSGGAPVAFSGPVTPLMPVSFTEWR